MYQGHVLTATAHAKVTQILRNPSMCSHKLLRSLGKACQAVDVLQYVFALTGGKGFEAGGEVYRSDDFGSAASWRNISDELEGTKRC